MCGSFAEIVSVAHTVQASSTPGKTALPRRQDVKPPRGVGSSAGSGPHKRPSCLPGSVATLLSMTKMTPSSSSRFSRQNMSSTPPTGTTSPTPVGLSAPCGRLLGPRHPAHPSLQRSPGAQNGPEAPEDATHLDLT